MSASGQGKPHGLGEGLNFSQVDGEVARVPPDPSVPVASTGDGQLVLQGEADQGVAGRPTDARTLRLEGVETQALELWRPRLGNLQRWVGPAGEPARFSDSGEKVGRREVDEVHCPLLPSEWALESLIDGTHGACLHQRPRQVVAGQGEASLPGVLGSRRDGIPQAQTRPRLIITLGPPPGAVAQEVLESRRHLPRKVDENMNFGFIVPAADLCAVNQVEGVPTAAHNAGRECRNEVVVGDGKHVKPAGNGAAEDLSRAQEAVRLRGMKVQVQAGLRREDVAHSAHRAADSWRSRSTSERAWASKTALRSARSRARVDRSWMMSA